MQNKIQDLKNNFKTKIPYKPTCEVGKCVRRAHFSVCLAKETVGV
jgi:hypothetical protein